jgi:phage-related baseplate assembly protein
VSLPIFDPREERAKYAMLARALAACTFLPASWDKCFTRNMSAIANDPAVAFTERQSAHLVRLVNRYRRQIDTTIVMLAMDLGEIAAQRRVEKPQLVASE